MRHTGLMKRISIVALVFIGAGVLLAVAAARTEIAFTDLFNPFGLPNALNVPGIGQLLDPGKVICPGYALTNDPMQPCPAGSRIIVRGFRGMARLQSSSAALTGWATLELNANYDPNYTGPIWGKVSLQLDNGVGTWEGTLNGTRRKSGDLWVVEIRATVHGLEGEVDGLQAKCIESITAPMPMPIVFRGDATCRVLQPDEE